ncbi:MAG: hypothetical protein WA139_01705 [Candidatus Aenigmatarchaeota archaeon]
MDEIKETEINKVISYLSTKYNIASDKISNYVKEFYDGWDNLKTLQYAPIFVERRMIEKGLVKK